MLYQIRFNSTLTAASWVTPSDTPSSETAVQSDTAATGISGGVPIYSDLAYSSTFFSAALSTREELNLDLSQSLPVTLAVRPIIGTSGTVSLVFRVREEW